MLEAPKEGAEYMEPLLEDLSLEEEARTSDESPPNEAIEVDLSLAKKELSPLLH